jgi:hypothetical protein
MGAHEYRFASAWTVQHATVDEVAAALADVEAYPRWWPQIRSVRRVSRDRVAVKIRSLLPYALRFDLVGEPPVSGQREFLAEMRGDLVGWSRWKVEQQSTDVVRVRFHERAVVRKRELTLIEPVARPAFEFNHGVMMRAGERGLRRVVAGSSNG